MLYSYPSKRFILISGIPFQSLTLSKSGTHQFQVRPIFTLHTQLYEVWAGHSRSLHLLALAPPVQDAVLHVAAHDQCDMLRVGYSGVLDRADSNSFAIVLHEPLYNLLLEMLHYLTQTTIAELSGQINSVWVVLGDRSRYQG